MKAFLIWYFKLWFIIWTHLLAVLLGIGATTAAVYADMVTRGFI